VASEDLTPRRIVQELDKYIIGQHDAKRAVAVALRNRIRRRRLPQEEQEEILPKNILMIGPTGVGKTEIARRLSRLVGAPFIKVEATKFTEVGYVGRDVESMVRDLLDTAIRMLRAERVSEVEKRAEKLAQDRIVDLLAPLPSKDDSAGNPFKAFFGGMAEETAEEDELAQLQEEARLRRKAVRRKLRAGELEDEEVEIEVEDSSAPMVDIFSAAGMEEMSINLQDMFGGMFPKPKKERRVTVAEAREILTQQEAQKLIDMDAVIGDAIERTEQDGIIFLDELDKVAGAEGRGGGPDVSREGVQRDILPIVEGSTVMTKHGPIKTDHILFMAAGAFHVSKPSDLIPELQGRFPIRVELNSLTQADFERILVEPQSALVKQYRSLLSTEGVEVEFTAEAIKELARIAYDVNSQTENIGARRLQTIMEKVLETLSFEAPEMEEDQVTIDVEYVQDQLHDIIKDQDLTRYIL
jgi:ATP-dependent HslUV protease ATP-binding subunit HslU